MKGPASATLRHLSAAVFLAPSCHFLLTSYLVYRVRGEWEGELEREFWGEGLMCEVAQGRLSADGTRKKKESGGKIYIYGDMDRLAICFFFPFLLFLPFFHSFLSSLEQQPTLYLFSVGMKDIVPMVNFLPRKNYYQLSQRSGTTQENRKTERKQVSSIERQTHRKRERELNLYQLKKRKVAN